MIVSLGKTYVFGIKSSSTVVVAAKSSPAA